MKRATMDSQPKDDKYPSREYTVRRWEALARDIVSSKHPICDDKKTQPGSRPGSLTVIGSGIQSVGFTLDCVERIRRADEVFFCVADAATQVWLRELRPDAYDLYVLYDDHKVRYSTYVQMSEAILHFVRAGKNVVTVFYGHPGIFVLSTHRAIAIARREGHRATMHAGISALDCLCADLAVDPSYPGMQTFEATDLLLRRRPLDPTLHTVLWQVGLIGEMGYRRRGYINDKFPLLVEYLADAYGEDHWVTHYIAARYPTIAPMVAHYPIRALLDPANRATFNGISTFYIAPKVARENDADMAVRLGLIQPGQAIGRVARRRQIDRYGPREREGVGGFTDFKVPATYQFQRKTRAAEFLVELTRSHKLARLFSTDPKRAVSEDVFPGLSRQERRYLMSRDEGRMQLAAKGMLVGASADEQFVIDILQRPALARAFKTVMAANSGDKTGRGVVDAWIKAQGYDTCLANFQPAAANVAATMLLPWSAIYQSDDGTVISILGDPLRNANSQVWLNCSRITDFTFTNGVLAWTEFGGGQVTLQIAPGKPGTFQRTLSGRVGTDAAFSADEVLLDASAASNWYGSYQVEVTGDPQSTPWEPYGRLELARSATGEGVVARLNGNELSGATFDNRRLTWSIPDGTLLGFIDFSRDAGAPAGKRLDGEVLPFGPGPFLQGAADPTDSDAFQGQYVAQGLSNGTWGAAPPVFIAATGIQIGSQVIQATLTSGLIEWSGGPSGYGSGRLQFVIDRASQLPYFDGMVWDGASAPASPNFRGQFAPKMLDSWSGVYPTTLGTAAGPGLRIVGAAPPSATAVLYQGQPVAAYSFSNGVLHATTRDGSTLSITFAYDAGSTTRSFKGQLTQGGSAQSWMSDGVSNDMTQWVGRYATQASAANGAFAPSAVTIEIQAASAADYSVVLSDGTTTVTLSAGSVSYDPTHNTLSWFAQTGTPSGNAFANASIALVRNDERASLTFVGSYWGAGQSPPAAANWTGVFQNQVPSGGFPWQAVLIAIGAAFGAFLLGAAIVRRFCSRVAEQSTEVELEVLLCKEKVDLAGADYALGAAADPCQEQEEEAEEEEDGLDGDDASAAEANPADMPAENGLTVDAEPNINVDVDTDVDVDVNIDVDVDVDVDVDIDVDIDVDVLFVDVDVDIDVDIDTDIDNVTDTVDVTDVDTVSVIST